MLLRPALLVPLESPMFRQFLCLAVLICGCQRQPPPVTVQRQPQPVAPEPKPVQVQVLLTEGTPPAAQTPLPQVIAQILQIVATGETKGLTPLLSESARKRMEPGIGSAGSLPILAGTVMKRLHGTVEKILYQGGRAIVLIRPTSTANGLGKQCNAIYFYLEQGRWTYDPIDMTEYPEPKRGPRTR